MSQQFTRKEVAERGNPKHNLMIIDNVVYDVTPFLDDHPGGHEVLHNVAGKDASEDFDDIGHSLDAKELMKKYVVGEVVEAERVQLKRSQGTWSAAGGAGGADEPGLLASWKLPVLLALVATMLYLYVFV